MFAEVWHKQITAIALPADAGDEDVQEETAGGSSNSAVALSGPLARVYVVNVATAQNRWEFMEASLGHFFNGRVQGLPRWQRFDAATPRHDGCDLPYSLSDCCTMSHMNVLLNFSRDTAVRDDQWVIVLEDDVALHPSVPPHRLGDIITAALRQAGHMRSPFMYLGLCSPRCSGPEVLLNSAHGASMSFRAQCGGLCTHAYAVQKFLAPRIPEYLKSMLGKQKTIDQGLFRISDALNMSLLGSQLRSHDVRSSGSVHSGIFYMKAFGDSLTVGDWELKPKVVFRLGAWSGRIGNLMFEWASVAALAARAGHETQAHFVTNQVDTAGCPATAFWRGFRLQRFSRDVSDVIQMRPRCALTFEEPGSNVYPYEAVLKLFTDIRAAEEGRILDPGGKRCKMIDVTVSGYLQSFRYFEGVEETVRTAFAPPKASKTKADAWLNKFRKKLADKDASAKWFLVGVQVRRGDKVHHKGFSSIYAPVEWDFYRAGMKLVADKLADRAGNAKVAFVITAGGSMGSNAQDIKETRAELEGDDAGDQVRGFAEGLDAYTDYALLAAMDAVVISASSFGWWAAYVSAAGAAEGLVVAPRDIYRPSNELAKGFKAEDYYPPQWTILANTGKL